MDDKYQELASMYSMVFADDRGQMVFNDLRDFFQGDAMLDPIGSTHVDLAVRAAMHDAWKYIETMANGGMINE